LAQNGPGRFAEGFFRVFLGHARVGEKFAKLIGVGVLQYARYDGHFNAFA